MTDAELATIDRRLVDRARPWVESASKLIASKVADARAHAERSLTAKAREADDGRPTARVLGRSRSLVAAVSRLAEARDALVGPSKGSLGGLVRDARASFYADSIGLWTPLIPERFRAAKDPAPTRAGEAAMRGAIMHGYDLHAEVTPAFDQAARSLKAILIGASRQAADPARGERMLLAWERTTTRNVSARVVATLVDSSVGVHHAVGRLMLHPDVRPEPTI